MATENDPVQRERVEVAEVAFSVRAGGADAVYTYGSPPEVTPGHLVLAPLAGRSLLGLVTHRYSADQESLGFPIAKLKPIEATVSNFRLPDPLLNLVRYTAREYVAPLPAAVALAFPAGLADSLESAWTIQPGQGTMEDSVGTPIQRELLAASRSNAEGARSQSALHVPRKEERALRLLEAKGLASRAVRLPAPPSTGEGSGLFRLTSNEDMVEHFLRDHSARRPSQSLVILKLRERGEGAYSAADLQALGAVGSQVIRSLASAGLLEPVGPDLANVHPAPRLNAAQTKAVEVIGGAVREKRPQGFLLFGVTGSGKTEVYLRAAAEALRLGRQVLYLVPEIALAAQSIGRLRSRFGSQVAIFHSELTAKERLAAWLRVASGAAPVVLGPRSALFAPLANLGLIVVDEEHEGAYKQEATPRYDARNLAKFLAEAHRCPLVMGSATPSLEAFQAAQTGGLQLLELPERTADARLPEVEIEDLGEGFRRGQPAILGQRMQELLVETQEAGEQAILFLNRRAYSPFLICRDCGHTFVCPRCAVSLSYSRKLLRLRCHHCGYQTRPPDSCPNCQGRRLNPFGVGTEKVEEAVRDLLPEARVARLDRDIAQRKGQLESLLAAFGAGEIDVLVGTQIVAKGLDFPNVTLVGVVAADVSLNIPDFRAAERTFQLLSQVSGRAGRGAAPGRVLIQTFNPDHIAVQTARRHDYRGFFEAAIQSRREARYPPFVRLVNIVFNGEGLADVIRAGQAARTLLGEKLPEAEILGPADCPIERILNRWRRHLLLKLPPGADPEPILAALKGVPSKGVQVVIDVDPATLV